MMKKLIVLALSVVLAIAPACGARKKSAAKTLSLARNMTMGQVRLHLGEPDEVSSFCDTRGNDIDVWEYNLGIRDEEKHTTKVWFQVGGWFLFWPLLCFPHAWRSSWTYEPYFFKFVNKLLAHWGRKVDIVDVEKEYTSTANSF